MLLGQNSGVLTDRTLLGDSIVEFLRSSNLDEMPSVDRCLAVALLLGDESDYHFWKACMRALPGAKSLMRNLVSHSDSSFLLKKEALKVCGTISRVGVILSAGFSCARIWIGGIVLLS